MPQMIAEGFLEAVAASWRPDPKATGKSNQTSQLNGFAHFFCVQMKTVAGSQAVPALIPQEESTQNQRLTCFHCPGGRWENSFFRNFGETK